MRGAYDRSGLILAIVANHPHLVDRLLDQVGFPLAASIHLRHLFEQEEIDVNLMTNYGETALVRLTSLLHSQVSKTCL